MSQRILCTRCDRYPPSHSWDQAGQGLCLSCQSEVRDAINAYAKKAFKRRTKDTEKELLATLRRYKMTWAEYHLLHESQDGRCAICRKERELVIDHCHVTGQVRGLLCGVCNTGLGAFGDNLEGLMRAVEYLSKLVYEQAEPPAV